MFVQTMPKVVASPVRSLVELIRELVAGLSKPPFSSPYRSEKRKFVPGKQGEPTELTATIAPTFILSP